MDPSATEYAKLHRKFLKEERPEVYAELQKQHPGEASLTSYLSSVGQQASDLFDTLMMQTNSDPKVQALPYQERVSLLQSRRHEANEVVLHDVVHQPLPPEG